MPRILIIDDDQQFLEYLREILQDAGYQIDAVTDGIRGLELLSENHFDLLITDIFMPEMDGLGVLRELRKKHHRIKIITMSGGGRGILPTEALDITKAFGITKSIVKPFTKKDILPLVSEILAE